MSDPSDSPTRPPAGGPRPGPAILEIPGPILGAMIDHCRRVAPIEACGLLGGVSPRVSSVHPIDNLAASETRYSADMAQVIAAYRSIRERGADILAIYHSHPRSSPVPSRTDLAENYDWGPMPRIIVSLRGPEPEVRIWRLEPDRFDELPWRVVAPDEEGDT